MDIQFFGRRKENNNIRGETNKDIARNANKIAFLFGVIAAVISFAALIVAIISLVTQKEDSFSEQIFQPIVYRYVLDTDSETMQAFEGYSVPEVFCRVEIQSGFPTRVAAINSDVKIENMYSYTSKAGIEEMTDIYLKFNLPFTSLLIYEETAYQYIFVYIEGADGSWHLDCVALSYDQTTGESGVYIVDELDLLRLQFEENEALVKILQEYQTVYQAILEIYS